MSIDKSHFCPNCRQVEPCQDGYAIPTRLTTLSKTGRKLRWIIGVPAHYVHTCHHCGVEFWSKQR